MTSSCCFRLSNQLGYNKEWVRQAVSLGHQLLTSRKYAGETEARQMALCYHLLLDQKRKQEQQLGSFVRSSLLCASLVRMHLMYRGAEDAEP